MTPVLLDSSVIVALLHRREKRHTECATVIEALDRPLATCEAAISESCYLLRRSPEAVKAVLANVEHGVFQIRFQLSDSIAHVHSLMKKYSDIPASFADACLIQMADELDTGDILTLDTDFLSYRWRRTRRFNLLLPVLG
ncbi:MAG: PIN domain-containing protein [Silvibacterium sp.]|nr:PIN domain-containing protein [Silvibacterium sp.]